SLVIVVRVLEADPPGMAVPDAWLRDVRVFPLVTPRMVADMRRGLSERRVLQRPSTSDQQAVFDPIRTVKTTVSKETMIPNRDPQAGHDVQETEHGPIHPRVVEEIGIGGEPDQGAHCDETEEEDRSITILPSQRLG